METTTLSSSAQKINAFTDLHTWQEGHKLVLSIYTHTKNFPREEQFGLTSQIRRASVSITSNIAEGFSRNSFKEKLQFYAISLGSVTEVQNQLMIAKDVGYVPTPVFYDLHAQSIVVSKLLNGLIKKTKTIIHTS